MGKLTKKMAHSSLSALILAMVASSIYATSKPGIVNEQEGCKGLYPIPECKIITNKDDCSLFYQKSKPTSDYDSAQREFTVSIVGQPCAWSASACGTSGSSTCTNTYTSQEIGKGRLCQSAADVAFIALFIGSTQT